MPQYGSVDAVPLSGPDPWDPSKKEQKLIEAEALLEGRVNEGSAIDDPEEIHALAANAYASYILLSGIEHPNDARSGDFYSGSNEDVAEVAAEMRNIWDDAVSTILDADNDESDETTAEVRSALL